MGEWDGGRDAAVQRGNVGQIYSHGVRIKWGACEKLLSSMLYFLWPRGPTNSPY